MTQSLVRRVLDDDAEDHEDDGDPNIMLGSHSRSFRRTRPRTSGRPAEADQPDVRDASNRSTTVFRRWREEDLDDRLVELARNFFQSGSCGGREPVGPVLVEALGNGSLVQPGLAGGRKLLEEFAEFA